MPQVKASPSVAPPNAAVRGARRASRPFLGLIDGVLVEGDGAFLFDGAIPRDDAAAAWAWMVRDIAPDLIDAGASDADPHAVAGLEVLLPELLARARTALEGGVQADRRLKIQLGSEKAWERLPVVLSALKCRSLLDKAQSFGRATNGMTDEAGLAQALQAIPLGDATVASLLMTAAVGQMANPSRLIMAAIRISGGAHEGALLRAGFGPLVDALLAHAQNQIPALSPMGAFADIDLVCRAIDRFHRLIRAINAYVELGRNSRWTTIIAAVTKSVSERLDPKLRDVAPDLNKALRRQRETNDRLDSDQVLSALNGVYLLAAVRDARDSLALNALFDQVWAHTGQALEIHIERNLQILRQNPGDRITSARLDIAIKMAELRFNTEYAEVLRRAKEGAERRVSPQA